MTCVSCALETGSEHDLMQHLSWRFREKQCYSGRPGFSGKPSCCYRMRLFEPDWTQERGIGFTLYQLQPSTECKYTPRQGHCELIYNQARDVVDESSETARFFSSFKLLQGQFIPSFTIEYFLFQFLLPCEAIDCLYFHLFPPDALSVISLVTLTLLLRVALLLSVIMQISLRLQTIRSAHVVSACIPHPVFTLFPAYFCSFIRASLLLLFPDVLQMSIEKEINLPNPPTSRCLISCCTNVCVRLGGCIT